MKPKRTPSQIGKSSRRKGHQWERDVAEAFRALFGEGKRGIGQARVGSEVPDVVVPHFWVECKVGARTNPRAALAQAEAARDAHGADKIAIAVCKDDRKNPTVTLSFVDFLTLAHGHHERINAKLGSE